MVWKLKDNVFQLFLSSFFIFHFYFFNFWSPENFLLDTCPSILCRIMCMNFFLVRLQGPHWRNLMTVRIKSTIADPMLGWHLEPKLDMLFLESAGCGLRKNETNKKPDHVEVCDMSCYKRKKKKGEKTPKQNQYLLKGIKVGKEIIIVWRLLKYWREKNMAYQSYK